MRVEWDQQTANTRQEATREQVSGGEEREEKRETEGGREGERGCKSIIKPDRERKQVRITSSDLISAFQLFHSLYCLVPVVFTQE